MQQFMNFNPYMTPQQRIAQMEQQYNMNFAQQPVQTVQQQGYKLVTIGSIEEAKAAPVDTINDTPSFFFNRGKNEIYLKQYNSQNGLPIFCTFQLVQEPTNEVKDKTETKSPENRPEYVYQIPLTFIPGLGKKTIDKLLDNFGTEMNILHKLNKDDLEAVVGEKIADNIISAREGKMTIQAGGGGVYGQVKAC